MCGRLVRERDDLLRALGVAEFSETRIAPRYNIAPTQRDLIVREEDGVRRLVESSWGLVPRWAKARTVGAKMFNARSETLLERPAYRGLVKAHRCVIPASGYYEWQRSSTGKQPHYIHRADGEPLALAGLWSVWRDPERGEDVTSHTVITCAPNHRLSAIHDRMPVVLTDASIDHWLDPALDDPGAVLPLLAPCSDELLTAHAVAPLVNSARNDGPDLIQPVDADIASTPRA